MASVALGEGANPPEIVRPRREGTAAWPLADRLVFGLCWTVGIGLCVIATAIVLFMADRGIAYLRPHLLVEHPAPAAPGAQAHSGGFLDPIIGTLIVTAIGTAIAAPMGIGLATWVTEYGRPTWLARALESGIETLAGVPSIVLAIFGLVIFSRSFLAFLSQPANGVATAQSFVVAGIVMSLLALPLVFGATRESLTQLPKRLREASFALGKTRATTIRRVLLPSIRPGMASGVVLGMGRIIGDTAILTILLGITLRNEGVGHIPIWSTLRGNGSTLTSYIYNNSPAGEGGSPEKAYAAAFLLLMIVLALNALVTRLSRDQGEAGGSVGWRGLSGFSPARLMGGFRWTR
ncbi:MAG TPA: ABC transporter permease subunit [Solirubrobacteraceae bacterium]|jgi:phosphate transport system permease protein|nr:ABC transporter permease subunit [Solirubrobacteraceae bacterium]